VGRILGDPGQDVGQPGLRIDIVQFGSDNQTVNHCGVTGPIIPHRRHRALLNHRVSQSVAAPDQVKGQALSRPPPGATCALGSSNRSRRAIMHLDAPPAHGDFASDRSARWRRRVIAEALSLSCRCPETNSDQCRLCQLSRLLIDDVPAILPRAQAVSRMPSAIAALRMCCQRRVAAETC
jgi:hypothetical protein